MVNIICYLERIMRLMVMGVKKFSPGPDTVFILIA